MPSCLLRSVSPEIIMWLKIEVVVQVAEKHNSKGSNVLAPVSNKAVENYYLSCPCLALQTLHLADATNECFPQWTTTNTNQS